MKALISLLGCALGLSGCGEQPLPGGYDLDSSATNRDWLKRSDGTLVTPGLVKALYTNGEQIVLIAHEATSGGEALPPKSMDGSCFVAFLIDPSDPSEQQIPIAQGEELAASMTQIMKTDRGCL